MKKLKSQHILIRLTAAAVCLLGSACEKPANVDAGGTPAPSPAVTGTPATVAATGPAAPSPAVAPAEPPATAEAEAALERVYRRAVSLDKAYAGPAVVGDFNADGSEDIALVVRPEQAALEELNSELANWIVADAGWQLPSTKKDARTPAPAPAPGLPRVERGERLLAIIHGYGPQGWRDAAATQSYLLRNAAGEGLRRQPFRGYPPGLKVTAKGANPRSDVITGKLAGAEGFLYWARGKYTWQAE